MRTIWWLGALYELLTRLRPRLTWRRWQAGRRWLIHLRDAVVCVAMILAWYVAVMVWA